VEFPFHAGEAAQHPNEEISNNSNTHAANCTWFGNACTNDTGLDGNKVFTGSFLFRVKEIEVFEITE
jgi:fructose-specific component phosphotransferase system IIB-like protein